VEVVDSPEVRARLTAWFARNLPGCSDFAIAGISRLSTGHSNDTYAIDARWRQGGESRGEVFVLRTRPEGVGLLEPYDVAKQFKVMKALEGTPVPLPKMYWLEEDDAVIGRPFFVMEKLEGVIVEQEIPEYVLEAGPDKIRRLCERYVETIAAIHNVDWRARGLEFLGDGRDFLPREIAWWENEVRRFQEGPLPSFDAVISWLKANTPAQTPRITLVHGDTKWGNVLLQDETVVAMFDWEMTAIGDPMTDVGWASWLWDGSTSGIPALPGAMSKEELLAYYEKLTGIQVHHLPFYETLEGFKMAAILYMGAMLFDSGRSNDLRYLAFGPVVPMLLDRLLATAGLPAGLPHGKVMSGWDRVVAGATDTVNALILPELTTQASRTQALALARLIGMFAIGLAPPLPGALPLPPEEEAARQHAPR
jgi:aminoglycoside phosphotransferase (APT) family kinase protein